MKRRMTIVVPAVEGNTFQKKTFQPLTVIVRNCIKQSLYLTVTGQTTPSSRGQAKPGRSLDIERLLLSTPLSFQLFNRHLIILNSVSKQGI